MSNDSAAEVIHLPHAIAIEAPATPMGPPDYAIYTELLNRIQERNMAEYVEVAELEACARGYVWGVEDALGHRMGDRVASWDFSKLYGYHAAVYRLGESTTRRPIADVYRCWMAGHNVLDREHDYCDAPSPFRRNGDA